MGDFEVGYGKPPQESRFPRGVSGNPKGRPKGSRNLASIVRKVGMERVNVIENGKNRTMPRIEAVIRQQWNIALKGQGSAFRDVVQLHKACEADQPTEEVSSSAQRERDRISIDSVLKRLQRKTLQINEDDCKRRLNGGEWGIRTPGRTFGPTTV